MIFLFGSVKSDFHRWISQKLSSIRIWESVPPVVTVSPLPTHCGLPVGCEGQPSGGGGCPDGLPSRRGLGSALLGPSPSRLGAQRVQGSGTGQPVTIWSLEVWVGEFICGVIRARFVGGCGSLRLFSFVEPARLGSRPPA